MVVNYWTGPLSAARTATLAHIRNDTYAPDFAPPTFALYNCAAQM